MVVTTSCTALIVHPDYACEKHGDKGTSTLAAGQHLALPEELFPSVFEFLSAPTLSACGSTCRSWKRLSLNDKFWFKLCKASWGLSPDELATKSPQQQGTPKARRLRRRARSEGDNTTTTTQGAKSPRDVYRHANHNWQSMRRQILDDQRMMAARKVLQSARVPVEVVDRMVSRRRRSRAWSFG